jgi:hypothetical protein
MADGYNGPEQLANGIPAIGKRQIPASEKTGSQEISPKDLDFVW